jgi:hypothetical protein
MIPGQLTRCADCDAPFTFALGKPGRIDQCPACATDVDTPIASECDQDGEWVLMPRRLRGRYEFPLNMCPREHDGEARL